MSLKSVQPSGRSSPKSGMTSRPLTARAASVALVTPGLPSVAASSSAHNISRELGNRARSDCATGPRFPVLKATTAG